MLSAPRRCALLGALGLLVLTGCAAPAAPAPEPSADTHGAIDGAAELAEPALGLTTIDAAGSVSHLDLLEETTVEIGSVRAPSSVHSDGRYLFAADDEGVSIVDSGVWTWDHVDHFHYYRAEARVLGSVEGRGVATVATSNSSTTGGTGLFFPASGEAVLLDTEALSKGEVVERFRLERPAGGGLVVPVGSFAAVASAGEVTLHAADGDEVGVPTRASTRPAPSPRGSERSSDAATGRSSSRSPMRARSSSGSPTPRGRPRRARRSSRTARAARPSPPPPGRRASGCSTPESAPGTSCRRPSRSCRPRPSTTRTPTCSL